MLKFFDKKSLSPEQKSRWSQAVAQYNKIQQQIHKDNCKLSEQEIEEFKKQYPDVKDIDSYIKQLHYVVRAHAGDEKSGLFSRLLNGEQPLRFAPPTYMSYPLYNVIEDKGPWQIYLDLDGGHIFDLIDGNKIDINQCQWTVLSSNTQSQEIFITYPHWQDLGFVWKITKKNTNNNNQEPDICSVVNFDPEKTQVWILSKIGPEIEPEIYIT